MNDSHLPPPPPQASPVSRPPRHKRPWIVILVVVALVALGGWFVYTHTSATKPNKRDQSVPVALATVGKGDIDIIDPALGTVTPLANVTVRTQIDGQLQEEGFQEGQIVQKGDFLAQVDPRPYQMTLEQAEGALQRDQALLKEAQLDLDRYQKLWAQNSISKQQLDAQASLVQQYEGATVTDQGQIDSSNLNIAYCHIVSPVTGRVGLRQIDPGNYAQTTDANGIVIVTELDPISAIFTLPEDQLPAVMKRLADGAVLSVTAYDRADSTKLADGTLTAVDNQIDPTTGTVKLRAQFANPDNVLFPNQFVNIQVLVDTLHDVVLVPTAAVLQGAPGTFVYVALADGTVSMRPVKLGVTEGDNVQVTDGLAMGDKVVIDGTDKLRDGAKYKLPETSPSSPSGKKGTKSGKKHDQSQNSGQTAPADQNAGQNPQSPIAGAPQNSPQNSGQNGQSSAP